METLIFRLYAPLASFGEVAVGEYRGSHLYPARSAVLGLLAAALGIEREDEASHAELAAGHQIAVALLEPGSLLRDYHTAQVPSSSSLKKRPHRTRADELALPKDDLNTILSTRDYRQDAVSLIAVTQRSDASGRWSLAEVAAALRKPRFTLYLGRKCCPPALPLQPLVLSVDSLRAAFVAYQQVMREAGEAAKAKLKRGATFRDIAALLEWWEGLHPYRVAWEDGVSSGYQASMEVQRKDQPLSRRRWQFADRTEHVSLLDDSTSEEAA